MLIRVSTDRGLLTASNYTAIQKKCIYTFDVTIQIEISFMMIFGSLSGITKLCTQALAHHSRQTLPSNSRWLHVIPTLSTMPYTSFSSPFTENQVLIVS